MEKQHPNRFPKSERLHHKSLVDSVFRNGSSFYEYPLRLTWGIVPESEMQSMFRDSVPQGIGKVQIMVTIPKKKLRHAVDRVRMRRLVKEAYRLQRYSLVGLVEGMPEIGTLSMSIIYLHDKKSDYSRISRKLGILLRKLEKQLSDETDNASGEKKDSGTGSDEPESQIIDQVVDNPDRVL